MEKELIRDALKTSTHGLKALDNEALLNKLVNAAIKLTKEENSKCGLTKKTDKEFQAVYNELLERLY